MDGSRAAYRHPSPSGPATPGVALSAGPGPLDFHRGRVPQSCPPECRRPPESAGAKTSLCEASLSFDRIRGQRDGRMLSEPVNELVTVQGRNYSHGAVADSGYGVVVPKAT